MYTKSLLVYKLYFSAPTNTNSTNTTNVRSLSNSYSHQRSTSIKSWHSSISNRSMSCEELLLPKPVCRKHSTLNYGNGVSGGSTFSLVCGTPIASSINGTNGGLSNFNNLHYHHHVHSHNNNINVSNLYSSTTAMNPFGELQQQPIMPQIGPVIMQSNKETPVSTT